MSDCAVFELFYKLNMISYVTQLFIGADRLYGTLKILFNV